MKARLSALLASIGLLTACAEDRDVDLGSGPIDQQGSSLVAFSGSWDGYAEGYTFEDGSDRVRLMIDADGNGVIQVGDSEPAAVPSAGSGYAQDAGIGDDPMRAGFGYPISGANVESKRLRAVTDPMQYYAAYCQQLASFEVGTQSATSGFSCNRGGGGFAIAEDMCWISLGPDGRPLAGPVDQEPTHVPIDCGLATCDRYCKCDANSCTAKTYEEAQGAPTGASFDGALEENGSKLVGTLVLGRAGSSTRLTVRMTRD